MKRGFLRASRYSPGNMDRESLESLFVGRNEVMEDVVDRVVTSARRKEKHYFLLVGPRGSGKTHFVALAYHRISDRLIEENASIRVRVALLNEEEWGIASYLDFLVRVLRALAQESPELYEGIDEIYTRFAKEPARADDFAEELLKQYVGGRTLILICENLIDLFHGLGEEGQKRWRSLIQESGFWAILATTPALFAAVTLQKHPFYGFFTVRELAKLDYETALELLTKKAIHDNQPDLAEFLRTPIGRARVRAVHHLAGGNHRAYVVLFDFLNKQSLDDLIAPFLYMVDDLTPYYQDQMRQLAPAQRKITEFLCHASRPMQIKDISASCLMSHQTAAKQIGTLASAGFVSKIVIGRDTFCELSEPLMRICIEIKDNRAEHFRLFVEFLRHWFSSRELERRITVGPGRQNERSLDQVHLKEAMRECRADRADPFIDALHAEGLCCLQRDDYVGLEAIYEKLVNDRGFASDYYWLMYALNKLKKYAVSTEVGRQAIKKYRDDDRLYHQMAVAYWQQDLLEKALSSLDYAIELDPLDETYHCLRGTVLLEMGRFEEVIEEARRGLEVDNEHWHNYDQIIDSLVSLGRTRDAEDVALGLESDTPDEPDALVVALRYFMSQEDYDAASRLIDKILELDPEHGEAHYAKGFINLDLGNHAIAAKELTLAARKDPNSVAIHCRLSDALRYSGQHEEAVQVATRLLELDPDHSHANFVRGSSLVELGRIEAGLSELKTLLTTSDYYGILGAASVAESLQEFDVAAKFLGRALTLRPQEPSGWAASAELSIKQGKYENAMSAIERAKACGANKVRVGLLTLQVNAAKDPLEVTCYEIGLSGALIQDSDFVDAFANALSISVQHFGPTYLHSGIQQLLLNIPPDSQASVVGPILIKFLTSAVNHLNGSLDTWERTLKKLVSCLRHIPECKIPLDMIAAAVRYTKTKSKRSLVELPLEQRQLLESAFRQVLNT